MAKTRQELIKEIELSLGGGMIDVELDPEHYDLAINKALSKPTKILACPEVNFFSSI